MKSELDLNTEREFIIGNIPTVIVNDHQWALYYWQKYGMKDATLFHIDAHNDLHDDNIVKLNGITEGYIRHLKETNFIVVGFYYGQVSKIFWMNPFFEKGQIMYIGEKDPEGIITLDTRIDVVCAGGEAICWANLPDNSMAIQYEAGNPPDISLEEQLILDIDLDAFSCMQEVHYVGKSRRNEWGWKKRIDKTIGTLAQMRRPDLITIARSQGHGDKNERYVRENRVDKVQEYLLSNLNMLYEGKNINHLLKR